MTTPRPVHVLTFDEEALVSEDLTADPVAPTILPDGSLLVTAASTGGTRALFAPGAWRAFVSTPPALSLTFGDEIRSWGGDVIARTSGLCATPECCRPEEPLAEWERELLDLAEPAPAFAEGDLVVLSSASTWDEPKGRVGTVTLLREDGSFDVHFPETTCGYRGDVWVLDAADLAPAPRHEDDPSGLFRAGTTVLLAPGAKCSSCDEYGMTCSAQVHTYSAVRATLVDSGVDADGDLYVRFPQSDEAFYIARRFVL